MTKPITFPFFYIAEFYDATGKHMTPLLWQYDVTKKMIEAWLVQFASMPKWLSKTTASP